MLTRRLVPVAGAVLLLIAAGTAPALGQTGSGGVRAIPFRAADTLADPPVGQPLAPMPQGGPRRRPWKAYGALIGAGVGLVAALIIVHRQHCDDWGCELGEGLVMSTVPLAGAMMGLAVAVLLEPRRDTYWWPGRGSGTAVGFGALVSF
ncbi:MAG: hypothetical protein R2909_12225 [Gemmatimonadales bacterium]